jgi:uncharacterized damage-inducible protein DinB
MGERSTTPQQSAARLKEIVDQILDEVHRMPSELVVWKPAADVWSVLENLCHIDEFVPFWTGEALNVVRDPTRTWGRDHTDTRRLAAVEAASTRTLPDLERSIRTGAAEAAAKLSALREADLQIEAASKNPRWGAKPAAFIVDDLIVHHVEKHLGQIRRNEAQYKARG